MVLPKPAEPQAFPPPNLGGSQMVRADDHRRAQRSRDKVELRAAVQESVMEFTQLRRARILPAIRLANPDASEEEITALLDEAQPMEPEWDPVIELSIMAVDRGNSPEMRRQAAAEAAQYLRPKLKSIDITTTKDTSEEQQRRDELAARLVDLLQTGSEAKRGTIIDADARPIVDQEPESS